MKEGPGVKIWSNSAHSFYLCLQEWIQETKGGHVGWKETRASPVRNAIFKEQTEEVPSKEGERKLSEHKEVNK